MKVILDTLVFGLQKRGGVSVYWYEFINRMLADEDIDLTLIKINGPYKSDTFAELDTTSASIIYEKGNNLQLLRNMEPKLTAPSEKAVFQSTYLRTCKKKNILNVVTIHDFTHQIYFKGIKKLLNSRQKQKALKNADGIVCISESTKRDLMARYPNIPENKIRVIYNGASDDYYKLASPKMPEKYSVIEREKYIIYVGDRFEYKNTNFLFEVLKKKPELHCVLIGGPDFSEQERSLMAGMENRVHRFTGVPNTELNVLYNLAQALIFPSLYEGFGIPVLEAMRAGCPAIAFNNSSIPEVLNGSGILLENNDLNGCIEALNRLDNDGYRRQVIKDQLEASKKFSWDSAYMQLKGFYSELLKSR